MTAVYHGHPGHFAMRRPTGPVHSRTRAQVGSEVGVRSHEAADDAAKEAVERFDFKQAHAVIAAKAEQT